MEYSIVISLFNEADNVEPLVEEIYDVLKDDQGLRAVILVDDGSTDDTLDRLRAMAERHETLRVIHQAERSGKSRGTWVGVRAARTPWVVLMDGDGQNDPRDIERLLAAAPANEESEPAMVAGLRMGRKDKASRRWASRFANRLRCTVLDDDCPDTGCALKLVRRDAFLAMPYFDSQHRYMAALLRAAGHRPAYVWVNDRPRQHGQSKYTNLRRALVGVVDLLGVFWLTRRTSASRIEDAAVDPRQTKASEERDAR